MYEIYYTTTGGLTGSMFARGESRDAARENFLSDWTMHGDAEPIITEIRGPWSING